MMIFDDPIDPRAPRRPSGPDCLFWMRLHATEIQTCIQRLDSLLITPEEQDLLTVAVAEHVRALNDVTDQYQEFMNWREDPSPSPDDNDMPVDE